MADDLIIKIGAKSDQFKAELDSIRKQTKSLQDGLNSIAKTGGIAFAALSGGIGGATKTFASFETKFADVVTLLDKSSFTTKSFQKGVNDLEKDLLKLGASSGKSFDDLNKGLFDLVSAGVPAEKSIKALGAATNLATAGATTVSVAVDGITSALNAFSLDASEAVDVSQKFFVAQKTGKTTVEELASGFGLVASSAAAYNVTLDELLSAVSAATIGGIRTNSAYTGLAQVFASISKPTKDAADEAERLGISFNSTALRSLGLEGFLKSLTTANGFTQQSVEKLFGSVEAQRIVFALTGAQADSFTNNLKILGDQAGVTATFQDALNKKQETTSEAFKRLQSSATAASIQIGSAFAPTINDLASVLQKAVKSFNDLDDETVGSIASVVEYATVTAGAITATALLTKGVLALRTGFLLMREAAIIAWASAFAPLAAGVAAIAGVQLGVKKLADQFVDAEGVVGNFSRAFVTGFDAIKSSISGAIDKAIDFIGLGGDDNTPTAQQQQAKGSPSTPSASPASDTSSIADQNQKRIDEEIAYQEKVRQIQEEAAALREEQRQAEIEAEAQKDLLTVENRRAIKEQEKAFEDEVKALEVEKNAELDNQELEDLRQKMGTRLSILDKYIKDKQAKEKADAENEERLRKLKLRATQQFFSESASAFETFAGKQNAVTKALRISEAIANTYAGATRALADYPAPYSYAVAAAVTAAGFANVSKITGAQKGGIVGGTGNGDTQPFMLEPGELIVPKPLVPSFMDVMKSNGASIEGGQQSSQSVTVEIDISSEASQFITARQREDTALGVS